MIWSCKEVLIKSSQFRKFHSYIPMSLQYLPCRIDPYLSVKNMDFSKLYIHSIMWRVLRIHLVFTFLTVSVYSAYLTYLFSLLNLKSMCSHRQKSRNQILFISQSTMLHSMWSHQGLHNIFEAYANGTK